MDHGHVAIGRECEVRITNLIICISNVKENYKSLPLIMKSWRAREMRHHYAKMLT